MQADDTQTLLRQVQLGSTSVTLLGTAHISRSSADQVAAELDSQAYRAVAIELCPSRFDALTHPDRLAELDLMQVLRQGKASMVMANLAMAAYQQRLGEQLGIEPGDPGSGDAGNVDTLTDHSKTLVVGHPARQINPLPGVADC